jgi:leucyl aminopeptidase
MLKSICTSSLLLLSTGLISTSAASQEAQVHLTAGAKQHQVDPAILAALEKYPDPVDAYVALHPEAAEQLAEPRLLRVFGESSAQWRTEGDKMRLKRQGKQFTDITGHEDFYKEQVNTLAGKARKFGCLIIYLRRAELAIANHTPQTCPSSAIKD